MLNTFYKLILPVYCNCICIQILLNSHMEIETQSPPKQSTLDFIDYIESPTVVGHELVKRPDIQNQIKSNSRQFVDFCNRNHAVCRQLLTIAFLTADFESQEQKEICVRFNKIMNSTDQQIIKLYINPRTDLKSSRGSSLISQQQANNSKIQQSNQQPKEKHQFLVDLLDYLAQSRQKLDSSVVGEVIKLLNTIIQCNPLSLLAFMKQRSLYLNLLIEFSACFPIVSDMFGNLLSEEVENNQYRQFKQYIMDRIIVKMKDEQALATDDYACLLDTTEILFSRNKIRSQEMEEIVGVTQKLVDETLVDFFVVKVLSICKSGNIQENDYTLRNCLLYLLLLANRIASDDEIQLYQSDTKSEQEPTMNFQLTTLLNNYEQLLMRVPPSSTDNITRLYYFQFLVRITQNRYFSEFVFKDTNNLLIHLMKTFRNQASNGLIKTFLTNTIEFVINNCDSLSSSDVLMIVSALGPIQKFTKEAQCKVFLDKILIILIAKNEVFKNHYKILNLDDKIKQYTTIIGAELSFIENKKKHTKQLKFLSGYNLKEALQPQNSKFDSCVSFQESEIDENFQICLPITPKSNNKSDNYENCDAQFLNQPKQEYKQSEEAGDMQPQICNRMLQEPSREKQ